MTVVSRFVFFNPKKKTQLSSNRIRTKDISIVIPVRDNQRGINNYLREFINAHHPSIFPKEIIIVDNNSKKPLILANDLTSTDLTIKLLQCKKPGPASARNSGVAVASGEWILFNDSDCIPTKDLLIGYLTADNGSIAYSGNVRALSKN